PSAPAPAGPLRSRPGLAGAVWLVGAALCLAARLAAYGTSMRRLRRGRVPLADETLADACRAAFGRSMRVYAVAGLDTPMLAGLLRPAVYLPEGAGLRADTLPYVLAHEARHRSAGDIPFQFVLAAACALHWFDPLVWCMARAARQDMELACDEAVLAGRDMAYRRAYGAAVLDVLASARRRRISALTTGFASGAGETRRRFAEMLSLRKKQRGTPLLCLLLALVVLASTLVACAAPARSDTAAPVYKGGTPQPTAGEAPEERLERLREELQTLQAEIGRLEALAAQDSSLEEIQRQYLQAQQEWAEWSAAVPEGAPSGGAAQFAWPLPGYTTLSTDFGTARRVYGAKDVTGMDIPARRYAPVYAAADGAASLNNHWVMGISVKLDHGGNLATLLRSSVRVRGEGWRPRGKGQLIGYVDGTGNSTGNHLHLKWTERRPVSAWPYLNAEWEFSADVQKGMRRAALC
ncbi:MAG: M23/M56 family metallopeptidase, partial [Ruthenibacterium lactatiformans]